MRKRLSAAAPVFLGGAWLLLFFAPLLSPSRALANRDVALFHLPLRTCLRALLHDGLPLWNPWLNGGQPLLSNPSYGAFYPPSWLALPLVPSFGLGLLVVLHGAIAFAGAWHLARRLGAGRAAAALAAFAFSGGGSYLSLLSALSLFFSMAWFPWVLAWGDAALRGAEGRQWLRPALCAGGAIGLQLLNGEPATVLMSGLGLLALTLPLSLRRPAVWLRAAVPVAAGLALAAVQLLPAARRLAESPRAGGLDPGQANIWSAPPARLVELAYPRFFGDPSRQQEDLYFGWHLHDRDYPYIPSLYPGLLMTLLGISGLALWPIPRRASWALAAAAGVFLALGRHNPLYEPLRSALPFLAILRFPEKFALLAVSALGFAGALGWQRLCDERAAGRRQVAELPLALALLLLATAVAMTGLTYARPELAAWFIRGHSGPAFDAAAQTRALAYLRGQGWVSAGAAAAAVALLAACRSSAPARRFLSAAACLLLAADLWYYGHRLVATVPAEVYRQAPPLAWLVQAQHGRLYLEPPPEDSPFPIPRCGPNARRGGSAGTPAEDCQGTLVRSQLARLEPYSGALWGVAYALNDDYDQMLTRWGALSLSLLQADWQRRPDLALRLLGAWDVGVLLRPLPPSIWQAEVARNPGAQPVRAVGSPFRLPRYRFVPRVNFHSSYAAALDTARKMAYEVGRNEHCVRAGAPPELVLYPGSPRLLAVADRGGRVRLRYRAAGRAFLTAAMTFDRGWHAVLRDDGRSLPVYPTALCQLGVELPAGEHELELAYGEPLLVPGAAVSLAALLAMVSLGLFAGRGGRGPSSPRPPRAEPPAPAAPSAPSEHRLVST